MNLILFSSIITFFATLLIMPIVIKLANKKKLIVAGGGRNPHKGYIPNVGGIAIFLGLFLGNQYFLFNNIDFSTQFDIQIKLYLLIVFGIITMFVMGLLDDIFELSSFLKFFIQFIVSFLIVYFGEIRINDFQGILGVNQIPVEISIIFSVLVMIFIINSYNIVDGLDGLAASLGIFILIAFATIFYLNGSFFDCLLAFTGTVSLLAFFIYNKPPAKIFMGDCGSSVIGYIIAYSAIKTCNMPIIDNVINPVFILCILAYPAIDTLRVFTIRILAGKSPFIADKNHIHHLLLKKNFNHGWISFLAVMYCAVLTFISFFFIDNPNLSFFIMVILALLFIILPIASYARSIILKFTSFLK